MVDMRVINDAELLRALRARYSKDYICTFVGPTLLVINPFRALPAFYNEEIKKEYIRKIIEGRGWAC